MKCQGSGYGSYGDYEGSSYGDCAVCGKDVLKTRYGAIRSHTAPRNTACRGCADAAADSRLLCPAHGAGHDLLTLKMEG